MNFQSFNESRSKLELVEFFFSLGGILWLLVRASSYKKPGAVRLYPAGVYWLAGTSYDLLAGWH